MLFSDEEISELVTAVDIAIEVAHENGDEVKAAILRDAFEKLSRMKGKDYIQIMIPRSVPTK